MKGMRRSPNNVTNPPMSYDRYRLTTPSSAALQTSLPITCTKRTASQSAPTSSARTRGPDGRSSATYGKPSSVAIARPTCAALTVDEPPREKGALARLINSMSSIGASFRLKATTCWSPSDRVSYMDTRPDAEPIATRFESLSYSIAWSADRAPEEPGLDRCCALLVRRSNSSKEPSCRAQNTTLSEVSTSRGSVILVSEPADDSWGSPLASVHRWPVLSARTGTKWLVPAAKERI